MATRGGSKSKANVLSAEEISPEDRVIVCVEVIYLCSIFMLIVLFISVMGLCGAGKSTV